MGHGRILASEGQVFFLEPDVHPSFSQTQDQPSEIIQVPRQPIHGMADHSVPFPNVAEELIELGTVQIFAGGFIDEPLVQRDTVQLPHLFLVQGADAQKADELAASPSLFCHSGFFDFRHPLSQ